LATLPREEAQTKIDDCIHLWFIKKELRLVLERWSREDRRLVGNVICGGRLELRIILSTGKERATIGLG